ncbi:MAG: cytochrome c [Deltaproteobacteria bacterium]|nr:cytochrome c [Deltaproteobacteria bacterium]
MKKLLAVMFFAGSVVLFSSLTARADGAGEALFKKKMCFACHGAGKMGGDLATSKLDKAAMDKFLKDPKAANPKSAMPAFKGTEEERAALVDYVMGLRK